MIFFDLLVHPLRHGWVPHTSIRVGLCSIIIVALLLYLVRVQTHELRVSVIGAGGPLACLYRVTPCLNFLATTLRWSDLFFLEEHVVCIGAALFRHELSVRKLLTIPLILTSACERATSVDSHYVSSNFLCAKMNKNKVEIELYRNFCLTYCSELR